MVQTADGQFGIRATVGDEDIGCFGEGAEQQI